MSEQDQQSRQNRSDRDESHDAGNPDRRVEPAPPTDRPKGDTESRVEHIDEREHLTPDDVKREQGKD